jgi:hypothetical protein
MTSAPSAKGHFKWMSARLPRNPFGKTKQNCVQVVPKREDFLVTFAAVFYVTDVAFWPISPENNF